ncbi:uncharacterized protein LOC124161269 isoform X2 [Ischnura elegans]|uniref:uncharacterized protein LOC124161269 isoform X2 n=1 Tax=Ischnura elegans TaxID=197161 RepID=UPI001ED8BB1B|nr:uncharacterized protein LOC124161269 isoform X2 [Ischnura elegans]
MFVHEGGDRRLRPTGILTSTAGTFVLDGTTTEFATKVYGTHLEGGVYAKIVSTSSRVFFAVPSAGSMARIRPTGLLSSATSTRVDGTATTLYTTEFSGTYIDGTYAQLVSSTSRVVQGAATQIQPSATVPPTETYQTATPPIPTAAASETQNEAKDDMSDDDQVVTVTGTRGALVDGGETKYDVFTGTHVKGDKTYLFFFGNTALSPSATTAVEGGSTATALPSKASELVVRTGVDDRIVVNVDNRQLNLVLPKSARASAAESGAGIKDSAGTSAGMRGVFIEGSELLGGFSIQGAEESVAKSDGHAPTEMLTVTVGRGVAQTRIVRGRYDGLGEKELETEIRGNLSPSRASAESGASERTVYRFPPRIPALRPPRPALGELAKLKHAKENAATEEEESENLLKARKLDSKDDGSHLIRPSKVHRFNLPTFTVGQEGLRSDEEAKVVVRVDHNVEARVGPRKEYRTLSSRQRLGKALPFRGFQVIHEKEDLVNAESGGSVAVPTITYVGFAEFTTTAHGTVIIFMPRSQEASPSTASVTPKITAVSAYNQPPSRVSSLKEGPAYNANAVSGSGKQTVMTGIKTFYSHTPGMVTRTVTGHSLSMQTTIPTLLVEPVFGISAHGREKSGRSEDDLTDAQIVYPTSDAPDETQTTEEKEKEEIDADSLQPSITQPMADIVTSTSTFFENAHARPASIDIDGSVDAMESSIAEEDLEGRIRSTQPLEPSSTALQGTETLPTGLIRSIGGTRAFDGTTTVFTSLIYGTYINGQYNQIIKTTTSILNEVNPTDLPSTPPIDTTTRPPSENEESSTSSPITTVDDESDSTIVTKDTVDDTTPPAITTTFNELDEILTTIPVGSGTTEENEIANEVETGRRVNTRPEEQVFLVEDGDSKNAIPTVGKGTSAESSEKGSDDEKPTLLFTIIPTTIYQTYTYFTTFFIPDGETTSTSIRSREVTSSEFALLTRSFTVTPTQTVPLSTEAPTTDAKTEQETATTPMLPLAEETPELPQDRITTFSDETVTAEPETATIKEAAPSDNEESAESEEEDSEEIELIFKTLYTTYTYLTTFFHDTTTSVSSREVVVTNILTSTLNNVNLATEPALAGLVRDHELSTALPSPSYSSDEEENIPTSVGVGRPTTMFFSDSDPSSSTPTAPLLSTPSLNLESTGESTDQTVAKPQLRTFYTTYTYFTTIFVDGETEISSRTEVYTNIITPSGLIQPTATEKPSPIPFTASGESSQSTQNDEEDLSISLRPSVPFSNANKYSSTIMRRGGSKIAETTPVEETTESLEARINDEADSISNPSEKHEEKQDVRMDDIQNDDSNVRVETTTTSTTMSVDTSEQNSIVTTEKFFGVTKFEEAGEPEKLVSEADDQESSESNTEVVLPVPLPSPTPNQVTETSLLLQTTFTTFTYFTTLYRGGSSDVISRLETVTNIMAVTVEPTTKTADIILPTASISIKPSSTEILPELKSTELPESLYPITYFTTFTYWTTAYKGGSTVVNSREETVSNIVTPTGKPAITREIELPTKTFLPETTTKPTIIETVPTITTKEPAESDVPSVEPSSPTDSGIPQLTTFYTTYTYFTTSYVGKSTIVNSRLETVTNVEAGDTQTPRAIGTSPPVQQQIITPTKTSEMPTGLLKTVRRSSVGEDSRTTVFSTDVYGTYIDGRYAQVLESSTQVLVEPSVTSTPALAKPNLQPTGVVSLNAGSIVDAEGFATTYFSTMAIGTYIGDLYAQVVESTSSVVIDTAKTSVPVNTAAPKTGLVRLIQGSIVKGETTTLYESRVIGTVINGRYAQIIESTSSFKAGDATKTDDASAIVPSPTSTAVLSATTAPTLESSLGDIGSSATPDKEEGEHEEDDASEEGEEEDDGDDEDGNNQGRGRVTSRLTFSSRKRTFTPVIRPFASRNRPTFNPRRRPTSATTITRVTQTPTVTATPAHTGDFAGTSLRGRFNSRRGSASLDIRPSSASNSRRFSRTRSSSPGAAYGSSSFYGGSRVRGSSSRIIPTAASTLPFGASRSRPGGYRSSFAGGGRSSSEYPFGRTSSSAALFAANSRFRIRPSSTFAFLRPTQAPSAPTLDRNTVEDEDEESAENEEDEDVGTDREETVKVTEPTESTPLEAALTPTTEGTTSPFRRPPLRLRRPPLYQPQVTPKTTPAPIQRTTASRRLGFLRRPSSEENLPTEDRKPNRGRYKASSSATTKSPAKAPTTPKPRSSQAPRLQVLNRARPTSSLFPRRGLFRRPGEEQEKQQAEEEANKEEESNEEERDEIVEEAESNANDGFDEDIGEDGDASDDSIADNDYEASEDVKSKNEPPRVIIRPFSPRRIRSKRQVEYGTRGASSSGGALRGYSSRFRRPGSSRKSSPVQEAEARIGTDEDDVYVDEEYSLQSQSEVPRQPPSRSRNSGQHQPRVRPSAPTSPSRTQFTITGNRNKNANTNLNTNTNNNRETTQRTNFRRPTSTSPASRRRTKGDTTLASQQQPRPKPPRLRSQSDTQLTPTAPAKSRSRGRGYTNRGRTQSTASRSRTGYRTSDLETNDYSGRRQYQSSRDEKITVTHKVPTEATIPVVNGKNTEYRKVVTASFSTQILTPGQYEATEIAGSPGLLLLGSDVTATPTPGIVHVTQYIARETPTSSIEFTPTVIRGRKTSFSHVVPSTAYGVEEVVSTIAGENGLLPSAPLANILLSQLLLGQFGLQGNVNPLLGLQQPNAAAALAPPTPTTEFKTRSTTFVTTLTEKTSTVIPITLRGKAIMTTIVDSSVQVVTATEFITDTIVVTPTAAPQQQLNSLLLPALLQAQLLNQQQPQGLPNTLPGQLSPLQAAQLLQQQQPTIPLTNSDIPTKEVIQEEEELDSVSPATERRKSSSSRRRNRPHKRVEAVDEEREDEEGQRPARAEENPRPKSRKNKPSSSRKQSPQPAPKQYETSVITLYVSGRRPGDFSTVLSTISIEAGSSLVKREAISPERLPTAQYVTDLPEFPVPYKNPVENEPDKFTNSLPYKDPNVFLSPSTVNYIPNAFPLHKQGDDNVAKFTTYETESLESIVGDVSKHVDQHSHTTTNSSPSQNLQPVSATNEKILAVESDTHAQTGYFLADGPAELAPLKRKVLSIDEGVEDEDDSDEFAEEYLDSTIHRQKRQTQYETGVNENPNPGQENKRRRVRVRVPVRKVSGESNDGSPVRVWRGPKRFDLEKELPQSSEDRQKEAINDNQSRGRNTDFSDGTSVEKDNDGTSAEDVVDLLKANFPSKRVKVLRIRPQASEEDTNDDTVNRGNRKRVKVLRRKKPVSIENDESNSLSNRGPQETKEENTLTNNFRSQEKEQSSSEKGNEATPGRRRVVVTRKRILTTSTSLETAPSTQSTARRQRITVTRRRPIHRQSIAVVDSSPLEPIAPTTSREESEEAAPTLRVTPIITPTQTLDDTPKTTSSSIPTRETPTARRIPPAGLNIDDFGSKKNSIAIQDKVVDADQKVPSAVKEDEKVERLEPEGKAPGEGIKVAKEEEVQQTGEWVASLGKDQYSATPPKTVEPSFWSGDETFTGETELLRQEPKSSIANISPDDTGATPEGPRFVRPTRFSVTRRPSGDFLQKVQGARTKAPIVFPSRRRPSASSSRQPSYRSRLSRLRGRPSSTSTIPIIETTTSDIVDTPETETTIEPTSTVVIEPSSTTPPPPVYVTETLTETLLKTYTYVVSRVESSVEAGVDQAAAAPPSLAAVSSTTEVKQVVKTRTVTRLLEPTATISPVPEASITKSNDISVEGATFGAQGRMNVEAARFNLATRVMSNGVEVIVAGDKTTLPGGPDVLRILSTASRPITLAPSRLTDQIHLTLPTALSGGGKPQGDQHSLLLSLQSQAANFVTKTYATTYTYLTTFLQGSSTVVSSREDVISNVVTEEVRPTKTIQQNPVVSTNVNEALTSKVDGPPKFVTSTYRTTFTYLNTIIDGEIPVVLTTRQTVANTVTAPANPSPKPGSSPEESDSGYLQPSEPTLYDTNTYFNTFTLTKTLSDSASGVKVISTEDVLTQVVITEASTPAPSIIATKINPTSTTDITKTYFVTYTYYNTFLEKGSTVIKTNVATSSDVVTEKFYLAPTKTASGYQTPSLTNVPASYSKDQNSVKTTEEVATSLPPLSVFATKTYLTTFTYFTTLLENGQTVTRSNTRVSTNLATEAITAGLDSVYLDSLRSSFSMQSSHSPIIATVMLSGSPMEITAFQGSAIDVSKTASLPSQKISATHKNDDSNMQGISPSKTTDGNVVIGSTIIFFDDIQPQENESDNIDEPTAAASSHSEVTLDDDDEDVDETLHTSSSSNNVAHTDTPEFLLNSLSSSPTSEDESHLGENDHASRPTVSYVTSTITASTVVANGNGLATTLVPGDAVIVSMQPDGNVSLIPVSDPSNKNPEGALIGAGSGAIQSAGGTGGLLAAASGGPNLGVGDLINLGSLSLNGLNALGPVFNAMAGLIQNNLKSPPLRYNHTITTRPPPTIPRTPPPIDLPRPPAPQSAPLIRDPVYIPVGGLASSPNHNSDAVASESTHGESIEAYYGQNFPIHGFPDTQERRPPPSPVKPSMPTTLTLDNPLLLQNGIPIQPGQVITTNSDVIVGKPSVLGPRPSNNGGVAQMLPHNYAPPPPPLPPPVRNPPPVILANNQPSHHYPQKPVIAPPPRTRPGNDVPPEMKPPPPPRYPSYSGVNPTRVSVVSGVETVFIGKPLPPHMVPEPNPPPPSPQLIQHRPTISTGPIQGDIGNYQPHIHVAPPIIIGSPLENLNPHPALQYNHNTIDRSTGYKIQPSQSFNIPIDAVTLSVGSETNAHRPDPTDSFLDVRAPLSGTRPGTVFNAGEPHSEPHLGPISEPHLSPHLTLGQAQMHKVPMGTGGEVVVEIGRPPVTDILKGDAYPEETRIITNDESSDESQGVVNEEEENLLHGQPIIGVHGESESVLHPDNIIVGHTRPQGHKQPQVPPPNYYGQSRPGLHSGNNGHHLNHVQRPHASIGAIHRPPPLSVGYTTGLNGQNSPADHLMPPPPPRPGTGPHSLGNQRPALNNNGGPIIIPLNHHSENGPQGNPHRDQVKPFPNGNTQHQWFEGNDEDLEDPEEAEGAQDGEVLQESNNRPVRPGQTLIQRPQEDSRPNTLPESPIIKEKPLLPQSPNSNAENRFPTPSHESDDSIPIHIGEINKFINANSSKGTSDKNQQSNHQQPFTLPEAPPYRFEIPDMQPPQPPTKPNQPTNQPPNSQRPPPGAVNRPAIRPQDYNPDFLDKPIRIAPRPLPPTRKPIVDTPSIQENTARPEISRPPVRVVVRPVNPHRPRPNYHNHHVTQSRPSQVWHRPLRPLKPPGPVPVQRVPSSSSRQTPWQPSFSSTSQHKDAVHTSAPPQRDVIIQPTRASSLGGFTLRDSSIPYKPILPVNPSFSAEKEPQIITSSPSSPDIQVESSGGPIVWDGNHFTAIPTAELPSNDLSSRITDAVGPTILHSGASTIYGGLYTRPTSTRNPITEPSVHGDLFLSPSSHGALAGGNGRPSGGHGNSSPPLYEEEDEDLEHDFEEEGGLGAAGSNDAATSIVVVSVTGTPTTRYITRTQTETRTVTQTVVESRPGSPPQTRTVIVTQTIAPEKARPVTIVSTIVGTVTEVHTTVQSSTTTAVTTVTITAPTHWILHTVGYDQGPKAQDISHNADNSQRDSSSTSKPIEVIDNQPTSAFFDVSFPLRPTVSIVSNKENDMKPEFGDKDGEIITNEKDGSITYGIDGTEKEDIREGFATSIITNEVPRGEDNYPSCNPECDAAKNEICIVDEEDGIVVDGPRCDCRPGFARLFPDRPCMPTYTYQLRLLLDRIGKQRLFYTNELENPQTDEFQQLHETAQDALERVAMQSEIRDLFHGISIAAFESPSDKVEVPEEESVSATGNEGNGNEEKLVASKENDNDSHGTEPEDGVIVNFYVKLSDNMDPDKLKDMFEKTLKQSNYSVGGTELFARRKEGLLEIYDFDECSDPYFNDCSEQAECMNLRGTYTCSCKEGYADLSENLEFPGRVCSAEFLGCELCKYHGQCYTNTNGEIGCKCFQWYSGDKCQINLKVLLIALVTVGAILLILVCVCIMFACLKRKKTDRRHTAPGFMRYIGPPGIIKSGGNLDKAAIIPDTSSESSFDGALPPPPLTYLPVAHQRPPTNTHATKSKGEGQPPERRMNEAKPVPPMGTSTMNTGFTEQDRSLTVMIPRAKYRPAPPLLATAAAQSPMTSFGVVVVETEARERRTSAANDQKLLAFLDATEGRQNSPNKKPIGPTIGNHETSGNHKKISSSRKPSTGALVSAGFEVSATVVKDKWPQESSGSNQVEDDVDDTSGTGRVVDGHLHHTLASNGSHFTTLRTGDRTVSEARSYDETIVHPPKKSLLHTPPSACGSKPSSQHGLHHSNDEAHTMAERDVGSTFLMPQTHLYKPSRGSDNSNFDSL